MDYEFKTSKQWKHQVVTTDDGFYWDSNFYNYNKVFSIIGIPVKINVNLAHWEHLDEYVFDIVLVDGSVLRQEINNLQRLKATTFLGNNGDAKKELNYLFQILAHKTYDARCEKHIKYFEKYNRYLLYINDGNTVSADDSGNIYKNEIFFGNWFPSKNELEISGNINHRLIRFRKISSTFLSKDRDCHISPFLDNDILCKQLELAHLGADIFNQLE